MQGLCLVENQNSDTAYIFVHVCTRWSDFWEAVGLNWFWHNVTTQSKKIPNMQTIILVNISCEAVAGFFSSIPVSALSLLQWALKCEGDDDRGDANRTSHHVYNSSLGTCHGPVSTGLQMRGEKLQGHSCKTIWLLRCLCGDIWLLPWHAFGSTSVLNYKNKTFYIFFCTNK